MPIPIHVPRINNNDDTVLLAAVLVEIGSSVRSGDPIVEIETDKANVTVESTADGYFLGATGKPGDTLQVGTILAWIGAAADEPIREQEVASNATQESAEPTLKARLLLKSYDLAASDVPHVGSLTAADVKRYLARSGTLLTRTAAVSTSSRPETPGRFEAFTPQQRGMARTVTWHRDEAVSGYVELAYDPRAWEEYGTDFQKKHGLLLNPLLSLIARRLVRLAAENPRINATALAGGTYLYDAVNLGFTVQVDSTLYVVVLRDSASKNEPEFVRELSELQRAAMKRSLKPEATTAATIGFTSMARWNITRHVPILIPQTAVMIAHSATVNGVAHLGASYDHRLLTGSDVARVLAALTGP